MTDQIKPLLYPTRQSTTIRQEEQVKSYTTLCYIVKYYTKSTKFTFFHVDCTYLQYSNTLINKFTDTF